MKEYRVIGLMSGTSLDGIDAALLRTDGEGHIVREAFLTVPYDKAMRQRIRNCFNAAPGELGRFADVERDLTRAHAEVVRQLLSAEKLKPADIDLIGFHGQTVSHAPGRGYTCQLGDGRLLAELTGIPVVNDFRSADIKAGGQGAPLVPVYHRALGSKLKKPLAFLNIGGVANVTYIGGGEEMLAFDTGPGNALLDDWMLAKSGKKYDEGGQTARSGRVDAALLKRFMSHDFFKAPPPKSLDRNAFVSSAWQGLSLEDGAATLSAFTVQGIVDAAGFLPQKPLTWIVSGGGRLNMFFMSELAGKLSAEVVSVDALGLNGDAVEAEAFGYLAVRSLRGLPLSFPGTTGVPRPMPGGTVHKKKDDAA